MVHKSKSENYLIKKHVHYNLPEDDEKDCRTKYVRKRVTKMNSIVKSLETSLIRSEMIDTQLLNTIQLEDIKTSSINNRLEQARKENKQLLNVLQQQNIDTDLSRSNSRSQLDISTSYSTVSMVHLQYKYEELLSSQEGLLKLLDTKVKEAKKCYRENDELRDKYLTVSTQLEENKSIVSSLCEKFFQLRKRKDSKIQSLRYERDTLKIAHEKLVSLLHKKCMEEDLVLAEELLKSPNSIHSLLIKEVKRSNMLEHENARLIKEVAFLKGKCSQEENKNIYTNKNVK